MGQYYKPVNLERNEFMNSYHYDNGAKLMEHSYIGNNFVSTVEELLSPNGQWYMSPIVWAGDYMDDYIYLDLIDGADTDKEQNLYSYAYDYFTEITPTDVKNHFGRYIVNHDKNMYVDKSKILLKFGQNLTIHPLPLLTSSGNSRGGGDYFSDKYADLVGTWAGDRISIEDKINDIKDSLKELVVYFEE